MREFEKLVSFGALPLRNCSSNSSVGSEQAGLSGFFPHHQLTNRVVRIVVSFSTDSTEDSTEEGMTPCNMSPRKIMYRLVLGNIMSHSVASSGTSSSCWVQSETVGLCPKITVGPPHSVKYNTEEREGHRSIGSSLALVSSCVSSCLEDRACLPTSVSK